MLDNEEIIQEITKLLPSASFAVLDYVLDFLQRWGGKKKA